MRGPRRFGVVSVVVPGVGGITGAVLVTLGEKDKLLAIGEGSLEVGNDL